MSKSGTTSGRFSCSAPNVMRLPRKVGAPPSLEAPYEMIQAQSDGYGAYDVLRETDVIYAKSHRAKVVKFDPCRDTVRIKFENPDLIPPEMDVPTHHLTYQWGGDFVNPNFKCPKCGVAWKETMLARFPVYDCPQCGAKKEDYVD